MVFFLPRPCVDIKLLLKQNVSDSVCLCCGSQAVLGERGAQGPIWQPGPDKYSRLDRQLQNANSQFIEEQQVQQQVQ